ncbi:DNA topoisomerase I [Candidatus Micrarchaeota archaeon]|nr:DNA topoisomerase I [Candidatus Micrarchaeota archaeon]
MRLIICEKPKVAEKVARALSSGKFERVKDKDVNYYVFDKDGKKTFVVSAVGHVYSLTEKGGKHWFQYPVFDIEWKPIYEVNPKAAYTKKYLQLIKKISKDADEIINSCDFDIEGSLIGYNIIRFGCKQKNAKLLRMKFSALTPKDLIDAYNDRFELDLQNSYAGEARHILDWYYGINLSRALMNTLRKNKVKKILSIGRVQGPALSLLVKREEQIKKFIPTPYWELWADVNKLRFFHKKGRFTDENEVKDILKKVRKGKSEITGIKKTKKPLQPPPPFDLTSLQVEAYNSFKFPPSLTLQLAQTLYENSYISYPRTSSQKLPERLGIKKILTQLSKQKKYSDIVNKLIKENRVKPKEGKKDDPAHPAIHPTGIIPNNLEKGSRESKLYDLIVRRFLACLAPSAERETWNATLTSEGEKFIAKGTHTITKGWLEYYPFSKLSEVEPPNIEKGSVSPKFGSTKKMTKPPNRYTQATLISELEKRELGTKATRAVVVDTLFKRGYLEGRSIEVKPLGMAIYYALEPFCPEILDEKLTRHFEREMIKIQEQPVDKAEKMKEKVINEGRKTVEKISKKFKAHESDIGKKLVESIKNEIVMGKCPKCGGNLVIRTARVSKKQFVGCSNFPKCKVTYPLPQNVTVTATGKSCKYCGAPVVKVKPKRGNEYELCLNPSCPSKIKHDDKSRKEKKDEEGETHDKNE